MDENSSEKKKLARCAASQHLHEPGTHIHTHTKTLKSKFIRVKTILGTALCLGAISRPKHHSELGFPFFLLFSMELNNALCLTGSETNLCWHSNTFSASPRHCTEIMMTVLDVISSDCRLVATQRAFNLCLAYLCATNNWT